MSENHKSDFRKSCIKKLKFVSRFTKNYKDKKIVNEIYKTICKLKKENVLLYIPLDLEVDVYPLIKRLRREKRVQVFVPYMEGLSFKAVKYRLPLKTKKFGIKEPNNSFSSRKIDLAIVPAVGIDGANKRIGFGKGMYDRFFYNLNYKPTILFTQRKLCKTTEILSDKYDIKADIIISS
ncbi:MAG: 5-formyltetrahydrofolate cyclo-ligase [Arcobacter sp.]|mgnify:CR=1 FL=1|uniref:5-formyltetrahydrofolate cyclo-ligase n=1 Tax=uncultured Arcobacter sp. TaxID=165434 RepID=UPI000CAB6FC9|nr:5-formyltetrahydrofolate cyclo-ligase [uncultured Arcobacter sp.]PLY11099.1 MAG: 5-formyltetrahydrofolate cyclo-ligase [Arcobacter sp.]